MGAETTAYPTEEAGSSFEDHNLNELFTKTHDSLWADIHADEAPLVRRGILRAQALREASIDPGDAFLQGMAIALGVNRDRETTGTPPPAA